MRKGFLPNQQPNQTQQSDERGQRTERVTVVVAVDSANEKYRTQELTFVNGRLARVGPVSAWLDE